MEEQCTISRSAIELQLVVHRPKQFPIYRWNFLAYATARIIFIVEPALAQIRLSADLAADVEDLHEVKTPVLGFVEHKAYPSGNTTPAGDSSRPYWENLMIH